MVSHFHPILIFAGKSGALAGIITEVKRLTPSMTKYIMGSAESNALYTFTTEALAYFTPLSMPTK